MGNISVYILLLLCLNRINGRRKSKGTQALGSPIYNA